MAAVVKKCMNEETTNVERRKTSEGKTVVTIKRGTKSITRLEHSVPSWMLSEE